MSYFTLLERRGTQKVSACGEQRRSRGTPAPGEEKGHVIPITWMLIHYDDTYCP